LRLRLCTYPYPPRAIYATYIYPQNSQKPCSCCYAAIPPIPYPYPFPTRTPHICMTYERGPAVVDCCGTLLLTQHSATANSAQISISIMPHRPRPTDRAADARDDVRWWWWLVLWSPGPAQGGRGAGPLCTLYSLLILTRRATDDCSSSFVSIYISYIYQTRNLCSHVNTCE